MEGIRLNHEVGSAQMCRKKSTEEGRMQGSMKGGRAKPRPPLMSMTTSSISPNIAGHRPHRLPLTTCLSLPDTALLFHASFIEEPVGCAVRHTITDGRRWKVSGRPRPSLRTGHRVAERSIEL